jgi:uncharacterized protein YqeY
MTLKEQFTEEMKQSMKSGDKLRLSTVRLLLSEIKNAEIRKKGDLTDEETLGIVAKEVRRRKEAIEGFEKGGRQDLVDKETLELGILQGYLPDQLSEEELRRIIKETIEEVGAASPADLGKVMGSLMPRVKGKADGKLVNQLTREMLQG